MIGNLIYRSDSTKILFISDPLTFRYKCELSSINNYNNDLKNTNMK